MGGFIKGDVVVLNFPFSDLSGSKRRPALVGRLTVTSIVRPKRIFTADKNLILYVACKIRAEKSEQVVKAIVDILSDDER